MITTYSKGKSSSYGLLMDTEDNMYLCNMVTDSVEFISKDGRTQRTILSKSHGLDKPYCICYRDRKHINCWWLQ